MVAAYCWVSTKFESNKVALIYKFLIMKPTYKVIHSENTRVFIFIMVVDLGKKADPIYIYCRIAWNNRGKRSIVWCCVS